MTMRADEIVWDMEPAVPRPECLSTLLDDVLAYIGQYVVMSGQQAVAVTLWIAHTWTIAAAECTPYVHVTSATKRAGKTRLLEVVEPVVAKPWFTGRTTAAALVRKIAAEEPTLLLDETDAAFKGPQEYTEALRGVLNSGYRRSGKATICIGQGAAVRAYDFTTFSPKMIAGIGNLPDTVADRSIPIVLRRRTKHEPVRRWRDREGRQEAASIRAVLAAWATSAIPALRDARPELPQTLTDRGMDVWEPLVAIADAAGDAWPDRARDAAVVLMGEFDDDAIGVQLLADTREVFGEADAISSAELVRRLAERDDRPWAAWSKGKPITGHALARLLKPFGIFAGGPMRIDGEVVRGYRRASFVDAWVRYLPEPAEPDREALPRYEPNKTGLESGETGALRLDLGNASETHEMPIDPASRNAVALREAGNGERRAAFEDGWTRYLAEPAAPDDADREALPRYEPSESGLESHEPEALRDVVDNASTMRETQVDPGTSNAVTLEQPSTGEGPEPAPPFGISREGWKANDHQAAWDRLGAALTVNEAATSNEEEERS